MTLNLTTDPTLTPDQVEQRLTDDTKSSEERVDSLATFNLQQIEDLNASANQVAGTLSKIERATFVALMTGDVHNRDIVALMAKEKVDSLGSFTWQMQLRFYWDEAEDDCVVRQVNSATKYGYEYQGALSRLSCFQYDWDESCDVGSLFKNDLSNALCVSCVQPRGLVAKEGCERFTSLAARLWCVSALGSLCCLPIGFALWVRPPAHSSAPRNLALPA